VDKLEVNLDHFLLYVPLLPTYILNLPYAYSSGLVNVFGIVNTSKIFSASVSTFGNGVSIYEVSSPAYLTSVSWDDLTQIISLDVDAPPGERSVVKVYWPYDLPPLVECKNFVEASWGFDSATKIVTLNATHASTVTWSLQVNENCTIENPCSPSDLSDLPYGTVVVVEGVVVDCFFIETCQGYDQPYVQGCLKDVEGDQQVLLSIGGDKFTEYLNQVITLRGIWTDELIVCSGLLATCDFDGFCDSGSGTIQENETYCPEDCQATTTTTTTIVTTTTTPVPGGGCPVLKAWDGKEFKKVEKLNIHSQGKDTTYSVNFGMKPFEDGVYKITLEETWYVFWEGSHLDYVKLINSEEKECELIQAEHSKLGDVLSYLERSDDSRVDLNPGERIELTFTGCSGKEFTLTVEGYNPWWGFVKLGLSLNNILIIIITLVILVLSIFLFKRLYRT
jgi:hypothetical protein